MSIRKAEITDLKQIREIVKATISVIYPHYYPRGAVEFFLNHHCEDNILDDIKNNRVFLCMDKGEAVVGTVTVKKNELCRLFVLPQYQGKGYGREMMDYAEKIISERYSEIFLDASLPAKRLYRNRGYEEIQYQTIHTFNNDFLCYDVMKKCI